MKNERTSKRVASDAGKLLRKRYAKVFSGRYGNSVECYLVPVGHMKMMRGALASALTQTADRAKADHSGARLERAYAAIREHSALCDSLFKDVADRDRVIWNLRDRVPGKKNLLLSKRERSVIRSALWKQIRQFLFDPKRLKKLQAARITPKPKTKRARRKS